MACSGFTIKLRYDRVWALKAFIIIFSFFPSQFYWNITDMLLLLSHFNRVWPHVRPHRWQPTRLPRPWDSPGKNSEVGCHFFLQCMKVKSESEVAQSCPTLQDPVDCSLPGSSAHGIFQARVLERGVIAFCNNWHRSLYIWGRQDGGEFRMGNTCIPVADLCW